MGHVNSVLMAISRCPNPTVFQKSLALNDFYLTVEAPLSGMSMNPARTVASAVSARLWTALWVYFTAPPLGMLLAAEVYVRLKGARRVICAKLHHHNRKRCIFRCGNR